MMSYRRTSTFSVSAARRAVSLIAVLKPTTIAFEADGEQDVVVADLAGALVQDVELDLVGRELGERVGDRAERARHVRLEDDPELLGLARLDLAVQVLERRAAAALAALGASSAVRVSTAARAAFSSATTRRMSPASGTSDRPRITAGVDGPAFLIRLPCSSSSARTRPNVSPTTMMSPTLSVPVWTSTVADRAAGLVHARLDDRADRGALRVGLELLEVGDEQDHVDEVVEARRRSSRDTGTSGVSPPYSSMTTPASVSSVLTRSGFASGLSILLSAMMIGTFAALAWSIASSVWGMTPSSAATTTTAMSVTFAPRARIAVNASWPGVSRKTTRRSPRVDLAGADVLGDAAALAGRDRWSSGWRRGGSSCRGRRGP